jgi:hypothetical protein
MTNHATLVALAALCTLRAASGAAQEGRSLDLTVNDVGISVGDSRRVVGLRLNFRDRHLEEVVGINATIWTPYEYTGVVRGVALGLPMTGARRIEGIAAGIFGIGVRESVRGLAIAGIGVGAGDDVRGVAISGIGLGAGEGVRGIAIGGIGVGAGGAVSGLTIGGVGVGAGGGASGILVGGVGAGVGGDLRGISLAGVGIGAGGRVEGVTISGVGMGAGGGARGVHIAGIGLGSGGPLGYLSVAGVGIGASSIEGAAVAAAVGAYRARGLIVAPAYFRITDGGRVNGLNVSALNDVRGTQHGVAIGLINYARHLDGLQLGLLNYAANKPRGTRLLPIANYGRSRDAAADGR